MRLWIAAILLFVFACQALPVAALGKALAKTQIAVADDDGGDGDTPDITKLKKGAPSMEDFVHHDTQASLFFTVQAAQVLLMHRADHLPVLYPGEVATPPPDFS